MWISTVLYSSIGKVFCDQEKTVLILEIVYFDGYCLNELVTLEVHALAEDKTLPRFLPALEACLELVGGGSGGGDVERNWRGVLIALLVILVVLSMILLSTVLLSPTLLDGGGGSRSPGPKIALSDLSGQLGHQPNNASWISETEIIYRDPSGGVSILNVENSTVRNLVSNSIFRQLDAVDFKPSSDLKYILLVVDVQKVYTNMKEAYYHMFEVETLMRYPVDAGGAEGESRLQAAVWGPRGSQLILVQENDLYYSPEAGRRSPGVQTNTTGTAGVQLVRITNDGSRDIVNGVPDWLYQEEIWKTDTALWFSPNGSYLAFASFNDSQVGKTAFTRYTDRHPYPELEFLNYPKAGTMNPRVTLCLVNLTEPKLNNFVRINQPKAVSPDGQAAYLTLVKWLDDERLALVWTNRRQNVSIYTICRPPSWNCNNTYRERAVEGSVVPLDPQVVALGLKDLLALVPVLDGKNGHYRQVVWLGGGSPGDIPLTGGQASVTKLHAWDPQSSRVYFEAAPGGRPGQRHLYHVTQGGVASSHKLHPHQVVCLTCPNGQLGANSTSHSHLNLTDNHPVRSQSCLYVKATFCPITYRYYILECLGPSVPTVHIMDAWTNTKVMTLDSNSALEQKYSSMSTPQIKIFQVEVEGGYHAQVKLQLPPGLREYEDMAFPMVLRTSFKPGEQCVDYRWSLDYGSYLASQKNFIVAEIDGRGSSGSGFRHMNQARLKLGNVDAQDQIAVIGYLRDNLKFVDKEKIGVFGKGYGGYLAGMILTQDTDIFQCGLAISGIYSWPHYNSVWTERWLATANVTDNLRGYEESDLTRRAGNLKDKLMLVIHGTQDRLVHYQHPMLLARALVQEGVLFKHISYPDEDHDLTGVDDHLQKTMDSYWTDCFGELDFTEWEVGSPYFSFKT